MYLIVYYFRVSTCVLRAYQSAYFRWRISDRVLNWYLHLYLGSCIVDVYYERIMRVLPRVLSLPYFRRIIACIHGRI